MPGGDDLLIRAALRDELSGPLAAIRSEIAATGREAELAGKRANIGARGFDKMAAGVGGIARTAGRAGILALKGISVAAIGAGGAAAYLGIKTASSMQQAKIAFTTMLGSAQKASAFLQKLQQFAAKTPFDFPGLQTAASSLISVGIKTRDVLPIMRTLGDVTAGMGTGAQGIQRATVALQQMNAAQAIHGQDLNQLRDAGIPVYDLLSKQTRQARPRPNDASVENRQRPRAFPRPHGETKPQPRRSLVDPQRQRQPRPRRSFQAGNPGNDQMD
jgi:tape measure domain-containing protein